MTNYSALASAYTLADVPAAPTLTNVTGSTMDVDVNPNGNPASTTFAIQCSSTNPYDSVWGDLEYVDASGNPSGTAVWRTDAQWGAITVLGLNGGTQYGFHLKARNADLIATAFGPVSYATTGECGNSADCDDGVACTVDTCESGSCANTPDDAFCDNDQFCDGEETCDAVADCQGGTYPCGDQGCDESTDSCMECVIDDDCDDYVFCNGAETCDAGVCQPGGGNPCEPDEFCDEENNMCVAVDALMTCQLSSSEAPASGSVDLDLFLQNAQGLRAYQATIVITRTSGSGEVTVPCPGGVEVDASRTDGVFYGVPGAYSAVDCANLRVSASLLSDCVDVGPDPAYFGNYHLSISADAEVGSTFEVAIIPDPYSFLRDCNNDPIPFAIAPVCTLTVAGAEMSCQLTHENASPGGSVPTEIFLTNAPDLRAYQVSLEVTRLTGTGEVTLGADCAGNCSDCIFVDTSRTDCVFYGLPSVFTGNDCENLRLTALWLDGGVDVGSTPAYLGTFILEVSADAAVDSTFLISTVPDPYSFLRMSNNDPIPFLTQACILTITEGCVEDGECDDGDDCTEDTCDPSNPESGSDGCVHDYQQRLFADIVPLFCPPGCPQPDLNDIICVLNDFGDGSAVNGCGSNDPSESTDLAPCGGDGVIDVDDILYMLDAFGQLFDCPHPCP
jgi:hypothetical protein